MALIVEDGTGKVDAESFASVAEADARHDALGMTNWATLSTPEKEQALRRATQYMEQSYRTRWKGTRYTATQALSWPRNAVQADGFDVAVTVVPVTVKYACIDLALKAAAGDLRPDLGRAVLRKKLGPLEQEFDPRSPEGTRYASIALTLAPYLQLSNTVIR